MSLADLNRKNPVETFIHELQQEDNHTDFKDMAKMSSLVLSQNTAFIVVSLGLMLIALHFLHFCLIRGT